MTAINKQKFLAELGRLLTFMYEEDRQLALSMYEKMFDSCSDDHALLQVLVSPTRQAVVLARAYDASERKLQVQSVSREDDGVEDDGELPQFVLAIDNIYQQAVDRGVMDDEDAPAPVLENQISIFDDDVPGLFDVEDAEPASEEPASEEEVLETPVPQYPENVFSEESEAEEAVEEAAEESLPVDEVDAFLASFSIDESNLVPTPLEEKDEESAEEECVEEESVEESEPAEEASEEAAPVQEEIEEISESSADDGKSLETVRKTNVFLAIVYSIVAIPLGLAGLALLLVPAALVLALATAVILAASASFAAAFGGFAVFADMLVILGTALIVSAVGLILLWLFIWFIGGAMAGFVKAIFRLGGKLCCKEVPAV